MIPGVELQDLIKTAGLVGMFAIIFAETGLLVGFFLPGDSLLFTAGVLASQGYLNIWALVVVCFAAAVIGDAVGYWFGHKVGRRLYLRPESRFFKPEHLVKAEEFFQKHGGKAIILARFMPIVRTFTPVIAGVSAMPYRQFATFNIVGAVLWAIGVPFAGYFLGEVIPEEHIDRYLLPIIAFIVLASVAPGLIHIWRENGNEIKAEARRRLTRSTTSQPSQD